MPPKVLVGCPTSEHKKYCLKEYLEALKGLSYSNKQILLVDNSQANDYYELLKKQVPAVKAPYLENARDRIVESRNILRDYALNNDFDYFLSLEQDIIPPNNIIEALLADEKEVVACNYPVPKAIDGRTVVVSTSLIEENGKFRTLKASDFSQKLLKVAAIGLGCVLIKRNVLEKIKFRYEKGKPAFDDMWFSRDCRNSNILIYIDTSIKVKHLVSKENAWQKIKK